MDGPEGFVIDNVVYGNKGNVYYCSAGKIHYVVKEYVMHRFIQPEPGQKLSIQAQQTNQRTQAWLDKMKKISYRFRRFAREDGLLVIPLRVYREGLKVYKVTYAVETDDLDGKKTWQLPPEQVDLLLKTTLAQLHCLARNGFVHGDIKPDNLIIRRHGSVRVASLIDYDGGFFLEDAHLVDDIDITPEFAAPELKKLKFACENDRYSSNERIEFAQQVSPATDVFGAGCVYGFWLTGQIPAMIGGIPRFPPMDPLRYTMIRHMTAYQPLERITAEQAALMINSVASDLEAWEQQADIPPSGWQWTDVTFSFGSDQGRPVQHSTTQNKGIFWTCPGFWTPVKPESIPISWKKEEKRCSARFALAEKVRDCLNSLNNERLLQFTPLREGVRTGILELLPDGEPISYEERFGRKPLSLSTADRIMQMILEAVKQIHGQGLILGTLSPKSIWFCMRLLGTRRYMYVYIGHLWHCYPMGYVPDPMDIDLPSGPMPQELINYMTASSNERVAAAQPLSDPRTDLWKLGRIYYFLLTGKEISSSKELDSNLDLPHTAVIRQALRTKWYQRTSSCTEMEDQLKCIKAIAGFKTLITVLQNGLPVREESVQVVLVQNVWTDAAQCKNAPVGDVVYTGITDDQGQMSLACGIPYLDNATVKYLLLCRKKQIPLHFLQERKMFKAKVQID